MILRFFWIRMKWERERERKRERKRERTNGGKKKQEKTFFQIVFSYKIKDKQYLKIISSYILYSLYIQFVNVTFYTRFHEKHIKYIHIIIPYFFFPSTAFTQCTFTVHRLNTVYSIFILYIYCIYCIYKCIQTVYLNNMNHNKKKNTIYYL